MNEVETLSGKDKAQVALGAAIGAGCRTCAENLYPVLRSHGATEGEIERVVADGLAVRERATEVMRRKAGTLMGRPSGVGPELRLDPGTRLEELIRTGAAVAASCAPDALGHIERARSAGATEAQIQAAIGIGRTVRAKAQSFSDEEIAKSSMGQIPEPEACCEAMSMAENSMDRCCG